MVATLSNLFYTPAPSRTELHNPPATDKDKPAPVPIIDIQDPSLPATTVYTGKLLLKAKPREATNKSMYGMVMNGYGYSSIALGIGYGLTRSAEDLLLGNALSVAIAGNPTLAAVYIGLYAGAQLLRGIAQKAYEPLSRQWNQEALKKFKEHVETANRSQIQDWRSVEYKDRINNAIQKATSTIESLTTYIYYSINIMVTIIAYIPMLFAAVSPAFIAIMAGVTLVLFIYYQATNQRRQDIAKSVLKPNEDAYVHNKKMADNIMLINLYNYNLWNERYNTFTTEQNQTELKKHWWSLRDGLLMDLITTVPCTAFLMYSASLSIKNAQDVLRAAPASFTLMRCLIIIMVYIFKFDQSKSEMRGLIDETESSDRKDWNKCINDLLKNKDNIKITHRTRENGPVQEIKFDELDEDPDIIFNRGGRWSISANNGSGKTTLFLALSVYFKENHEDKQVAHWFPNNSLIFENMSAKSSGQASLQQMEEIFGLKDLHVLMLDEWDGWTDPTNTEAINKKIDEQVSKGRVVLEIRQAREDRGIEHSATRHHLSASQAQSVMNTTRLLPYAMVLRLIESITSVKNKPQQTSCKA